MAHPVDIRSGVLETTDIKWIVSLNFCTFLTNPEESYIFCISEILHFRAYWNVRLTGSL